MALRSVNRAMSTISGHLTRGLKYGALAGGAALAGVFHAVNRTTESMDALAKKTRAMDFPIEEYQKFQFAAEQSGVKTEIFDKSLQKFTKTVGELKGGYGAMYTALKKTNPELLKQLKDTDDVSDAFKLYLGAIEKTPGAMGKAAMATAGFGRSGMDMINLANAGTGEIGRLMRQQEENGIVTAEQAAKAEEYNDMMNRLGRTVKGFLVDVISPLLPELTKLADSTRKWMVANKGIISTKFLEFIKKVPEYMEDIAYWGKKIAKYVAVFYGLSAAVKVASAAMWLLNTSSKAAALSVGGVGKAGAKIDAIPGKANAAAGSIGKIQGAMGALAAFAVGWEIGTIIHDKLVEPLMEANQRLYDLSLDINDTMGRDLSKRNTAQLQQDIKTVNKAEAEIEKNVLLNYLPGMDTWKNLGMEGAKYNREKLQSALNTKQNKERYAPNQSFGDVAPWEEPFPVSTPTVSTSRTETVNRSEVEINIKDETGRASVKQSGRRGGGTSLNLVHTGAAQ